MSEKPDITILVREVETAQIDTDTNASTILEARLQDGSLAYLSFDAKALSSLEAILHEVRKKFAKDQGVQ
ncbi:hypothetical protein ACEQ6A_11245 [Rhizobium brockwellii]|uniref:hypothetical protein n=1 Tax=Rhizobium brockwellii TaxID=3019932 RepID=UPI003F980AA5